jgi:hypothetical protein
MDPGFYVDATEVAVAKYELNEIEFFTQFEYLAVCPSFSNTSRTCYWRTDYSAIITNGDRINIYLCSSVFICLPSTVFGGWW